MISLYHAQFQSVLDRLYSLPTKLAVMLTGTFGIGKTAAVRLFAQRKAKELGLIFSQSFEDVNDEKKFVFLVLPLHQYEPAEIKGLPFPNAERTQTVYLPVGLLPTKGQGIILLDEINLAPPMLQSNAYQLIEDRRLGFYTVPDGVMIIGAGNRDDDRGHTFDMAMPLNNRFLHAELAIPPVDDIEVSGEKIKGWANDYAIPSGVDHRIVNYLMYQKKHLFTYDPTKDVCEPTIATPRMWEKVSTLIKGIPDTAEDLLYRYIGMGVGTGIAQEMIAWLKLSRKYDIKKIFASGTFTKPVQIDQLYSLISAFVGHYLEKQTAENAVRLLELACILNKEHTCMLLNQAKHADKDFFAKIKKSAPDKFTKLADSIFPLLI